MRNPGVWHGSCAIIGSIMHMAGTDSSWRSLQQQIADFLHRSGADASRSVVLLPYAQLLPLARRQWAALQPASVLPRFETTANWVRRLAPFVPGLQDLAFDPAQDWLTAWHLLQGAGQKNDARWLASRVREAALQLAPVAAARPPQARVAWWQQVQLQLRQDMAAEVLRHEAVVAMVAVAWAGSSAYATDRLFDEVVADRLDALVVLRGFQPDPLAEALLAQWEQQSPGKALTIDLPVLWEPPADAVSAREVSAVQWHQALDLEDQAACAAACVQQQVAAGGGLVALVDNDRALTRRIRALLQGQGLAVRDETGWKLSTTRAASHVMGLLRACDPQAESDTVLGWLKLAQTATPYAQEASAPVPAWQVQAAEAWLRQRPRAQWPALSWWPQDGALQADWLARMEAWRGGMQAVRSLPQWLQDVRQTLTHTGQWQWLEQDVAGQAVLQALHLSPGALPLPDAADVVRWNLAGFTHWVQQVLESGSFKPPYPLQEQVVILPLSQLLARDLAAVVIPGCDEVRMAASPEPPGDWTGAQRRLLGLPQRQDLQHATLQAWQHALQLPRVVVLTSHNDGQGELLLPSPLLLHSLQRADAGGRAWERAADPLLASTPPCKPPAMPGPSAHRLPLQALSASAYDALRACPYQFFGQQHLRLREVQELASVLEKRDFGNWLHRVLYLFHVVWPGQAGDSTDADAAQRRQHLDEAARMASEQLGVDAADFVPWQAIWPRMRDGYLHWLQSHTGEFVQGEEWQQRPLAEVMQAMQLEAAEAPAISLQGRIDRRDRLPSAGSEAAQWLLIDYKSESGQKTRDRVNDADEDTQLAFYAALHAPVAVQVGYLNVGERGETSLHMQPDIDRLSQQLLQGIAHDLHRAGQGAPLPALGQGVRCTWCAMRGLCRKDFWEDAA